MIDSRQQQIGEMECSDFVVVK